MSQLRTVTRSKAARGFGTGTETHEQLQVKHEFSINERKTKNGYEIHIAKIKKPKWEDVPHEDER